MRILLSLITALLIAFPLYARDDIPASGPLAELYAKAKAGDADAQYNLAEAYRDGEGVQKDLQEAAKWYHRSAVQGNTDAQFALGFVFRGGDGVQMNKVLSYMWFEIAAKNGDTRAFNQRNDVAWSMTEPEIEEARKKAKNWKPNRKNDDGFEDDEGED